MSGPGHHTTQRFHRAQFAGDRPKGHVWIYDKSTGNARSDLPENISVENHFYSIEKDDGTWDSGLDDWITGVEGTARPVYDTLLNEDIPQYSQAKYDFALYLAVTYARTRTRRRVTTDAYGQMVQSTLFALASNDQWFEQEMKDFEAKHGTTLTEQKKQELRDIALNPASKITVSVSKSIALESWRVVEILAPLFLEMEWTIIKPQHGYFITSDNPLLRKVADRPPPGRGDGGFLNKTAEISFPLSPKKMLLLEHREEKRTLPTFVIPREIVEGMNHARAAQGEREIYAHIKDKRIAKMILEYKNWRPNMKLYGMGPKQFAEVVSPRRFNK
jgi:hypothetical protein